MKTLICVVLFTICPEIFKNMEFLKIDDSNLTAFHNEK